MLSTGCDFGKIANLINVVQIMQLPPCRFWAAQAARAVYNSIFPQFTPHFCLTIGHDRRLCLWMDMLQCLKIPLEQGKTGKTGELSTCPHGGRSAWVVHDCGKPGCTWAIHRVKPQPKYALSWGLCISLGWLERG